MSLQLQDCDKTIIDMPVSPSLLSSLCTFAIGFLGVLFALGVNVDFSCLEFLDDFDPAFPDLPNIGGTVGIIDIDMSGVLVVVVVVVAGGASVVTVVVVVVSDEAGQKFLDAGISSSCNRERYEMGVVKLQKSCTQQCS